MTVALSARETAYRTLRSRILNMDLKPNDDLNDKELAQQMGMSRTPIHEAIITLALANLVVVRPQSGTYVSPIDTNIVEIEKFSRFVLEKEMVLQAIPRMTDEAAQRYRENLQIYQFILNAHDPNRTTMLFELDDSFHRLSFELNGKADHFDWMLAHQHHIERVRVLMFAMKLDKAVTAEHQALIDAMKGGDAAAAVRALEIHLGLEKSQMHKLKDAYPHYFQSA